MNAPAELTMNDLSDLALEYLEAKTAETAAVERRRALGALIAQAMPEIKSEGIAKIQLANVKVSVTYGINRTVDSERLKADWVKLSDDAQAAFRWKADVSTTAMRTLQGEAVEAVQAYITARPTSPTISVEVL
jgi:hypothetical protein